MLFKYNSMIKNIQTLIGLNPMRFKSSNHIAIGNFITMTNDLSTAHKTED